MFTYPIEGTSGGVPALHGLPVGRAAVIIGPVRPAGAPLPHRGALTRLGYG